MFRYKLHWADGSEAGEASYAMNINAGDLIWIRGNHQIRVLDVVVIDEDDSPYAGLLRVSGTSGEPTNTPQSIG